MFQTKCMVILWSRASRKAVLGVSVMACLSSLGLCASRASGQPVEENQLVEENWKALHAADTNIHAAKTQWQRVLINQPQPNLNIEKMLAEKREQWRQEGVSDDQIIEREHSAQQLLEQSARGWEQTSTLDCLRQVDKVRCAVTDGQRIAIGAPTGTLPTTVDFIDFYDGKDSVVVENEQEVSNGVATGQSHFSGRVRRDGSEIMPHVGSNVALMLTGAPLFRDYNATNSTVAQGENNTLIVDRQISMQIGQMAVPLLMHWVISKQTWRPVLMEERWNPPAAQNSDSKKFMRRRAQFLNYQRYPGGVWWPGHLIYDLGGIDAGGKAKLSYDYKLLKANFNEYVDPALLQRPIPKGSQISDYRFSPRPIAGYEIQKGIPSDAEVLKIVKQREEELNLQKTHQMAALPILPLGLLFCAVGSILWKRAGHKS